MKNPKSAMISCNDGFRPESFLLEVMDEEAGALEFVVEGEKKVLRNGDSVYIAPDEIHSATALERTLIIDMFAPMREDFLE